MASNLSGPRLPAKTGNAERLIILCHGYGADGNDLIGLAPHWQNMLPAAAFVAPNGPQRCDMSPTGYQWFPISRMDPEELGKGIDSAAPLLDEFIDEELDRHGLGPDQLALVGFSQGTMLSLHVGLRRTVPPAAIVGFSGMLALPERMGEITARPPVLLIHGDQDDMIPAATLFGSAGALGAAELTVQWHISHGIGHSIGPDGVSIAGKFLLDAFQGRLTIPT